MVGPGAQIWHGETAENTHVVTGTLDTLTKKLDLPSFVTDVRHGCRFEPENADPSGAASSLPTRQVVLPC